MYAHRNNPRLVALVALALTSSACVAAPVDGPSDPMRPSYAPGTDQPELPTPQRPDDEPPRCEDCAFDLSHRAILVVRRGDSSGLSLSVGGDDSERDVELELVGLPDGVLSTVALTRVGRATRIPMTVSDTAAVGGPHMVVVRGRSGDDVVERELSLYVADTRGAIDMSYGRDGLALISVTGRREATMHGAALGPDGGVWLVGAGHGDGPVEAFASRVTADGTAHHTPILPPATSFRDIAVDASGRVTLHGVRTDSAGAAQRFVSVGAAVVSDAARVTGAAAFPELEFPTETEGDLFVADDRIYLVGHGVQAFDFDGAPHAAFGDAGSVADLGFVSSAAPDGQGGLYVLRVGEGAVRAAHVTAGGQLDGSFGGGGAVAIEADAIVREARVRSSDDGTFTVIVHFERPDGSSGMTLARYLADGDLDDSVGDVPVYDRPLAMGDYQSDRRGGHLVVHRETDESGAAHTFVARTDHHGSRDLGFGDHGQTMVPASARTILVDSTVGRAYLIGERGDSAIEVTRIWL